MTDYPRIQEVVVGSKKAVSSEYNSLYLLGPYFSFYRALLVHRLVQKALRGAVPLSYEELLRRLDEETVLPWSKLLLGYSFTEASTRSTKVWFLLSAESRANAGEHAFFTAEFLRTPHYVDLARSDSMSSPTAENRIRKTIGMGELAFAIMLCLAAEFLVSCNLQKPRASDGNLIDTAATIKSTPDTMTRKPIPDSAISNVPLLRTEVIPLAEADTIPSPPVSVHPTLNNREVFLVDSVTGTMEQLTFTQGNVDEVSISPNGKYLAYIKVVDYVDSPGEYQEGQTVPEDAVHAIVVVNLASGKTTREIPAPEDIFISFDRWISDSRFLFETGDGFAVGGFYVYDAFRDSLQKVKYGFGSEW